MQLPPPPSGFHLAFQERLVLLVNHVLCAEPVARDKLLPHQGRVMELTWSLPTGLPLNSWLSQAGTLRLVVTPAGLFELAKSSSTDPEVVALHVTITLPHPLQALDMLRQKRRPEMRVVGDAAYAEVISWMAQNLRWDIASDLQQWVGMPISAGFSQLGQRIGQQLARWKPTVTASNQQHQGRQ